MPIINIITWPTPKNIKEKLITEVTKTVHNVSGAPLDKITVYIQEIERGSWGEAGILGSDPEFPQEKQKKTILNGE